MASTPKHVAVIMDGNGRWAKKRGMPRFMGHRSGAKAVRRAVEAAIHHQVDVLSLFALSVENRALRPLQEVNFLYSLFLEALEENTWELHQNNVRIQVVGDIHIFETRLQDQIRKSIALTAENKGLTLVLAVNYSGRWDILQATKRCMEEAKQHHLDPATLDDETYSRYLSMAHLPDPDLLIRTSGEQRISNFMLWQCAYSEIYFTTYNWPDFNAARFKEALEWYSKRQRRFGKTGEQVVSSHA